MNTKYNLKDLMDEIKGAEWEVKEIGDIAEKLIGGDSKITKSSGELGKFGGIICSDIFNSSGLIKEFSVFVDENSINQKVYIENGDIVIARSGYTEKNSNGCSLFLGDFKVLAGNDTYVLKHSQNPKYLINAFSTESFKQQTKSFFKPGLLKRIYTGEFKKIKIPIPSLEIQQKVADFLFLFSEADRNLRKEIQKRRKQFHYFKEKIFESLIEKCRLRNENLGSDLHRHL